VYFDGSGLLSWVRRILDSIVDVAEEGWCIVELKSLRLVLAIPNSLILELVFKPIGEFDLEVQSHVTYLTTADGDVESF